MFRRWFGNRSQTGAGRSGGPLGGLTLPAHAGMLSCRVLDPVNEPVQHAEFVLTDTMGRRTVGGETDPYGSVFATVPPGEYRLAVTAEGFTPFHGSATVTEGGHSGLGDLTLQVAQPPSLPEPGEWEIEPMHSQISFTARHIGLARIHGRFNTFAGAVRIADHMEQSAMHVIIDAASIDTNVQMRDDHLRSEDFLDVARFPVMEFYSERFVHRGGSRWGVTGALTLHGVSRTVTLDTQYLGIGNGMEGEVRAACRATTELHRDDFTVRWQTMLARGIAVVGNSITIDLDVQIVKKKAD
ncbi:MULTISPECIES: YceI family protein [unclassified Streptomyces]|uniref:YceI family protein n=1 Tax=unclassified Streptomyces TaxID=2593676 RepID=UPI002E157020|nr:YceI family protein [Streptomyces sp. NBC_01197]WSS49158.1 YceI family protein [Streptomyces sp. NBC_01180]